MLVLIAGTVDGLYLITISCFISKSLWRKGQRNFVLYSELLSYEQRNQIIIRWVTTFAYPSYGQCIAVLLLNKSTKFNN